MTHVTCRLTAKNRDQLRNPTLGNRVWANFTFLLTHRTHLTRLTVVRPTFSSESACSFNDITQFSSARPSRLKMKSTCSHYSLVLVFLVFNPGVLYYMGYVIIIIIITSAISAGLLWMFVASVLL